MKSIPEPDYTDQKENRLNRWQLTQQLHQQFWKRWSQEYLTRLQQRPKWLQKQRQIQIGDLVLIKSDGLSPAKWPLARVIDIHAGEDGLVRSVRLRTATGELTRPIVKLCLLPFDGPDDISATPPNKTVFQAIPQINLEPAAVANRPGSRPNSNSPVNP